jgi:hypothetical protein
MQRHLLFSNSCCNRHWLLLSTDALVSACLTPAMIATFRFAAPVTSATSACRYAPYQAAGEKKVAAGGDGLATDAEDAAIAQWLVEQGAGRRVKLLGASELRGRGLDWDTDPGSLAREGLHVVLPDGRDVHIPAGTDLDWQGELRRVWGFGGKGC